MKKPSNGIVMELLSAHLSLRNFTVEWSVISFISNKVTCQVMQVWNFRFYGFFQNQLTLLLAQFHCPSRSFGYRPRTTCSGCWTVLAAIWFNIKLVSSMGSRFFRLLTVAINNYFFILCASPGLRSLEIMECKLGVDQIFQFSFAYSTEV